MPPPAGSSTQLGCLVGAVEAVMEHAPRRDLRRRVRASRGEPETSATGSQIGLMYSSTRRAVAAVSATGRCSQ